MRILRFLEEESEGSYRQLFIMAAISGVANGLLLAIVNHAAHIVATDQDPTQFFLLYMATFALYLYAQWFAFDRSITLIENAIYNIRTRLSRKIQKVELAFVEQLGTDTLYSRMTQNDTFISQAMPQITSTAQMSILMVSSFLYLAYISPLTFFITLITISAGITMFRMQSAIIDEALRESGKKQSIYFRSIADLVNGFKEIKVNRNKSLDVLENIEQVSAEAKELKVYAGRKEARMWGFGRIFIYALLPILVFLVPMFHQEYAEDIFKITATLLFISGPITVLVNLLPVLGRVNLAVEAIQNLEQEMDAAGADFSDEAAGEFVFFEEISVRDLSFSYPNGQTGFVAGPFSERIQAGEMLFIIGGNGSGKSTFLKLLTGLYPPSAGGIFIDEEPIKPEDYRALRELFSIVFTDFHLFERLYGIRDLNEASVNHWIGKMWLEGKVRFHDGAFSSTNLSTGQRKRLAFIAAILEDKPILAIDEFAADQDPQFRKYFYESLLPEIKQSGKTIIAVTHDDHYFHVADRVLKMDEGKIFPYEEHEHPT
jgi:putative ATP-binding cassette transporter